MFKWLLLVPFLLFLLVIPPPPAPAPNRAEVTSPAVLRELKESEKATLVRHFEHRVILAPIHEWIGETIVTNAVDGVEEWEVRDTIYDMYYERFNAHLLEEDKGVFSREAFEDLMFFECTF